MTKELRAVLIYQDGDRRWTTIEEPVETLHTVPFIDTGTNWPRTFQRQRLPEYADLGYFIYKEVSSC